MVEQDVQLDLKLLKETLNSGRLSFGSPDRLMEFLGVRPGAVTPFAMINGAKNNVRLFLDLNIKKFSKIYAHPLVNDRTLEIKTKDLIYFFDKIKVVPNWIKF